MPKPLRKLTDYHDSGAVYPHGKLQGDPNMVDDVLPPGMTILPLSEAIRTALHFKGNQTQLKAFSHPAYYRLKLSGLLDRIIPSQRKKRKPLCPHCLGRGWIGNKPCLAEGCRE